MPSVTCPSCGEKGRIPDQFIGTRIKCKKCGASFFVAGTAPKSAPPEPKTDTAPPGLHDTVPVFPATEAPARPRTRGIAVEGLDDSEWARTATVTVEYDPDQLPQEEAASGFAPSASDPEPAAGPARQYKVLTPKDKFFDGNFTLELLEKALNHYAHQGWVVKGMATPHVAGFSGGEREQLVILLER